MTIIAIKATVKIIYNKVLKIMIIGDSYSNKTQFLKNAGKTRKTGQKTNTR
jgi:hypothetical protein